jgi:hypothetical protein
MVQKHFTKTKDYTTGTPLKIKGELRCSRRIAVLGLLLAPFVLLVFEVKCSFLLK